jgi:hypothetical protein
VDRPGKPKNIPNTLCRRNTMTQTNIIEVASAKYWKQLTTLGSDQQLIVIAFAILICLGCISKRKK